MSGESVTLFEYNLFGFLVAETIREYIDAKYKTEKVNYGYHYQGKDGNLIFRYDNARHRPTLGFIDHKHLSDGTVIESAEPDIADVIDEVISHI